jgi:hypothetical protein
LTIVAQNSTLGDILRAVHARTGASVDMPSNSTERVVGHFGPGPAREVLASLLNGSHFDYVLLGTTANPNALDRVVLMVRPIGPAQAPAVEANANPGNQPQPQPGGPAPFGHIQTPPPQAAEDVSDEAAEDSPDEAQADEGEDQAQPAQPGVPVAPKSPEELLQQLQQQQQQQQQGAPPGMPANPGQGPRMPLVNNPEPQ